MILFLSLAFMFSIVVLFGCCLAQSMGHPALYEWISWIGWGCLATTVFCAMGYSMANALAPAAIRGLRGVGLLSPNRTGDGPDNLPSPERRRFLALFLNSGLVAASGSLAACGLHEGFRFPQVKAVTIRLLNLPPDLEALRIVQLSDLHITEMIRPGWVASLVACVNSLNADLIALTGDIADGPYPEIGHHVFPLKGLKARFGSYFVTGNHEYLYGARTWTRVMEDLGMTTLVNDHRLVWQGRGVLLVGGVADYSAPSRSSDVSEPETAMGNAENADVTILLAHQPRSVYGAARAGFDLQLSGHTHGGQFGPAGWLRSWGQPYQSGLYAHENMQIYVSNGTGFFGVPFRLGAPSEITLLTLTSAKNNRFSPQ